MRELGELKWFLGIRVLRDRTTRKIWLCQDSYITKICTQFRRSEHPNKAPKTPMSSLTLAPYEGTALNDEIMQYSRIVGFLTYSTAITRPDTAFTTKSLAEALQNPGPEHFNAAYRCLDYLESTKYYALELGGRERDSLEPCFGAASDAAYADDPVTRRSTEGSLFQLFGGTIDWQSKKQATVTTSTTEAELLALSHICAWLKWWGRFFNNLGLEIDHIELFEEL